MVRCALRIFVALFDSLFLLPGHVAYILLLLFVYGKSACSCSFAVATYCLFLLGVFACLFIFQRLFTGLDFDGSFHYVV